MARISVRIAPLHPNGTECDHAVRLSGKPRAPAPGCTGCRSYAVVCSACGPVSEPPDLRALAEPTQTSHRDRHQTALARRLPLTPTRSAAPSNVRQLPTTVLDQFARRITDVTTQLAAHDIPLTATDTPPTHAIDPWTGQYIPHPGRPLQPRLVHRHGDARRPMPPGYRITSLSRRTPWTRPPSWLLTAVNSQPFIRAGPGGTSYSADAGRFVDRGQQAERLSRGVPAPAPSRGQDALAHLGRRLQRLVAACQVGDEGGSPTLGRGVRKHQPSQGVEGVGRPALTGVRYVGPAHHADLGDVRVMGSRHGALAGKKDPAECGSGGLPESGTVDRGQQMRFRFVWR